MTKAIVGAIKTGARVFLIFVIGFIPIIWVNTLGIFLVL